MKSFEHIKLCKKFCFKQMSGIDLPSNRMERSQNTNVISTNSVAQSSTQYNETLKKNLANHSSQTRRYQLEIAKSVNNNSLDLCKTNSVSAKNKTLLPLTRCSFMQNSSGNNQSTSKSWYSRCNRWRSLSSDRRKNSTLRYSWNTGNNNPM